MFQAATLEPSNDDPFGYDVLSGLLASPKRLPSKYLYDAEGSRLFDEICHVPEYYVTRAETALLTEVAREISAVIPNAATLVEFGSGASVKTLILLDAAPQISRYVPIDISPEALSGAAEIIRSRYPGMQLAPIVADFTVPLRLPATRLPTSNVGFFPGSTIGNFSPDEAVEFLRAARSMLGRDPILIVGADLAKPEDVLIAAYDDVQGVTAAFNLNILHRINRELGADFDVEAFAHQAVWNAGESRIEMHLVSERGQQVHLSGQTIAFASGETIHTESSYKYDVEGFEHLAQRAGWQVQKTFRSPTPTFAVFVLDCRAAD